MRSIFLVTVVAACLCGSAFGAQEPAKQELARHQGTWTAVSFRREGQETPAEIVRTITRTVEGDHVVWKRDGKSFAGTTVVLDPGRDPRTIDVLPDGGPSRGKRVLGIYKIEKDTLTLCMADPDQPRPREFKAEKGSKHTLMVFKRQAAAPEMIALEVSPPAHVPIGPLSSVLPSQDCLRFSSGNRSIA